MCCRWAHTGASGAQNDYHAHSACPADTARATVAASARRIRLVSRWIGQVLLCPLHRHGHALQLRRTAVLQRSRGFKRRGAAPHCHRRERGRDLCDRLRESYGDACTILRIRRLLVQIAQRQPSRLSVPGCTLQPPKQTVLLHELAFALAATLATTTLATTTLSPSPHGSAAAVLATLPAHSTTLTTRSARSARSAACATAITAALYTRRRRSLRPR